MQDEAANLSQQQNQWRSFMDWDQRSPSQSMQSSSSSMLHQLSPSDATYNSRYSNFSSISWPAKSEMYGSPDPSSQVKLIPCFLFCSPFLLCNKEVKNLALQKSFQISGLVLHPRELTLQFFSKSFISSIPLIIYSKVAFL